MRTAPTTALLGLLLVLGCTSASDPAGPEASTSSAALAAPQAPPPGDFTAGTCRVLAPDVLALGALLPRLGEGGAVDQAVQDELRDTQGRVQAATGAAEPELKPALAALVESVGLVRIRAVSDSYERAQGENMRSAYDGVLDVCT